MKKQRNLFLPSGNAVLVTFSVLAVFVVCGLFFLLVQEINKMKESAETVSHTTQVRNALSQTLAKVKDAESRQRGFLLTNDHSFLVHVINRQHEMEDHLAGLRKLVSDNRVQTNNVDTLSTLIRDRLHLLDDVVTLHFQHPENRDVIRKEIQQGKETTDAIESKLSNMDSLEVQLLSQRTETTKQFAITTPRIAAVLVLAALALILAAFYRQWQLLRLSKSYLASSLQSESEALRKSLLLKQAEAISQAGSWEWNHEQNEAIFSTNMYRLLGCQPGDLPDGMKGFCALIDKPDRKALMQELERHRTAGRATFSARFWATCRTGERKYFESNNRFSSNDAGETIITGTVRDITGDELLKQQLQQRKDLIESIVENSSDLIAVIDTDMRYTVWNKANEKQFGKTKGEVIGQRIDEIFPFIKHDERLGYIQAGLQGHAAYLKELPYYNGEKTAEFSYVPLTGADGSVVGLLIMAHDITDRKLAAENLQRANAELQRKNADLEKANAFNRLVTDLAPNNIVVFDVIRQVPLFLNRQAREMFGLDPENLDDIRGKLLETIIHPDDLACEIQKIRQLQAAGDAHIVESDCRFKNSRGQYRQMHIWRAVFKRNDAGEVEQIVSISIDVTDLKKAEKELKERNRELQHANEEISSFNYIASHDLQEPLRKVQMFANVLEESEKNLTSQSQLYLDRIQKAAARMRSLINDLLSFSQVNLLEKDLQPVNLNLVLANSVESLGPIIRDKQAQIKSNELPIVRGVSFQLQQLFDSILGNAVKYSKPGEPPRVSVTSEQLVVENSTANGLEKGRLYYHLRFADNGIGFKPEYGAKIFELFERLHNRQEFAGTGLGLAICKKVVQNHHGIITATGCPGEGATIDVYLPALF